MRKGKEGWTLTVVIYCSVFANGSSILHRKEKSELNVFITLIQSPSSHALYSGCLSTLSLNLIHYQPCLHAHSTTMKSSVR